MTSRPEVRLVPMTREQTNAIARLLVDYDQRGIWNPALTVPIGDILTAWDAAPRDPAEALTAAICEKCYPQCTPAEIGDAAAAVILAIGYPLPASLGCPDPERQSSGGTTCE